MGADFESGVRPGAGALDAEVARAIADELMLLAYDILNLPLAVGAGDGVDDSHAVVYGGRAIGGLVHERRVVAVADAHGRGARVPGYSGSRSSGLAPGRKSYGRTANRDADVARRGHILAEQVIERSLGRGVRRCAVILLAIGIVCVDGSEGTGKQANVLVPCKFCRSW